MELKEYIYQNYRNSQKVFADAIGRSPQMVSHYIKMGYIVDSGRLIDVKVKLPAVPKKEITPNE